MDLFLNEGHLEFSIEAFAHWLEVHCVLRSIHSDLSPFNRRENFHRVNSLDGHTTLIGFGDFDHF